jgi:hypothetical protein
VNRVERVLELSDQVIAALSAVTDPDVALMAIVDAGVRILKHFRGIGTPDACIELARVVEAIGVAEADAAAPQCSKCGKFLTGIRREMRLPLCARCG